MTEQEAINGLLDELGLNEPAKTQEPQPTEPTKADEPSEPVNADSLQDMISKAMNNIEAQKADEAQKQAQQAQDEQAKAQQIASLNKLSPEMIAQLESLGLGSVAQLGEQVAQLQAQLNEQQEQARQRATFEANLTKFNAEFPTIKPDELGKWAEANGVIGALGEDYQGWKLVAMAMMNTAKPKSEPDQIISDNVNNAAASAFDRLKKGEEVSDVDIGASLLKEAGML